MSQLELVRIQEDGSIEGIDNIGEQAEEACEAMVEIYKAKGYEEPWTGYLAMLDGTCVGTCAFKSPPEHGRIEIAYNTFPEFEGRGVATQMAQALVEMAMKEDRSIEIAAHTLPEVGPSSRVLEKNGFALLGLVGHQEDGDVWEWVFQRSYH